MNCLSAPIYVYLPQLSDWPQMEPQWSGTNAIQGSPCKELARVYWRDNWLPVYPVLEDIVVTIFKPKTPLEKCQQKSWRRNIKD